MGMLMSKAPLFVSYFARRGRIHSYFTKQVISRKHPLCIEASANDSLKTHKICKLSKVIGLLFSGVGIKVTSGTVKYADLNSPKLSGYGSQLIKMFSSFGTIISEDFLWHTRGPKRGEPRGYAFIQYGTREEAQQAKEKMNGKLACGRPLVVRFSSEKNFIESTNPSKTAGEARKLAIASSPSGQSRGAKIAAIKNKLKEMEAENGSMKKQRPGDGTVCSYNVNQSPN